MTDPKTAKDPSFAETVLSQTLVFRAGQERFGLPLSCVLEVFEPTTEAIAVPGAPNWLAGIINHHGKVIPVVRADKLLKVEPEDPGQQTMLIDMGEDPLALQVDQIEALEEVRSEGPMTRGRRRAWLRGTLLTLLEPELLDQTIRKRLADHRVG